MTRDLAPAALVFLAAVTLADASGREPSREAADMPCDAEAAAFAVGQRYHEDVADEARKASGAAELRVVPEGLEVPMAIKPDRLTLWLDGDGTIARATCG